MPCFRFQGGLSFKTKPQVCLFEHTIQSRRVQSSMQLGDLFDHFYELFSERLQY